MNYIATFVTADGEVLGYWLSVMKGDTVAQKKIRRYLADYYRRRWPNAFVAKVEPFSFNWKIDSAIYAPSP